MSNRLMRINDEILKEISNIVRLELNDPRINVMTSVLRVDTTSDLKYCKIYISVLGDEKQQDEVMEGLNNASGYIRKLIAKKINLRITPSLKFILDKSMENSFRINRLIDEVLKTSQKE